jgi:hypothetical protein
VNPAPDQIRAILPIELAREAFRCGRRRYEAARARGGRHRWGYAPTPEVGRFNDAMAAVTERLVAAAIGRAWTSDGLVPDAPGAGDVDGGISVRWRRRLDRDLIVHADEREDLRVVLVVGPVYPRLAIVGWVWTHEAQSPEYWLVEGVRHPAYFVPQDAPIWKPIETLRAAW